MELTVTGHRPNRLGGYDIPNPVSAVVNRELSRALDVLQPTNVLLGMALGVDQWTAQLCVVKKIPFVAVIPFTGYELRWPPRAKAVYYRLLDAAQRIIELSPGPYRVELLHQRNEFMVDNSDRLLAVWDGLSDGGTAACVRYALQKQKHTDRLNIPVDTWVLARDIYEEKFSSPAYTRSFIPRATYVPRHTNTATVVKEIKQQVPLIKKTEETLLPPRNTSRFKTVRFIEVGEKD